MDYIDDTIAAICSPIGQGAIAIIRISGSRAFSIVSSVFVGKDLSTIKSHSLTLGHIVSEGKLIDQVLVSIFRNPKSYTGEDVIELQCHGSVFIQKSILTVLIKAGCRHANPGEFSYRAFLNNKIDLVQAESVADLIASSTEAQQISALSNLSGQLTHSLKDVKNKLLHVSSMLQLELDFAEEDVVFADRTEFDKLISSLLHQTNQLLNSFQIGSIIRNGFKVAIIGAPNAGKSTLLNALLNRKRAIVSDIPGTTRDTIEEEVSINGLLVHFIDTAGLRQNSNDIIENIGIERSIEQVRIAQLNLFVYDASQYSFNEAQQHLETFGINSEKVFFVANKIDKVLPMNTLETKDKNTDSKLISISAQFNEGIEELKQAIFQTAIGSNIDFEKPMITNVRHFDALCLFKDALSQTQDSMNNGLPTDLLSFELKQALIHLGSITGDITNDQQLDYIFSKFCIGK